MAKRAHEVLETSLDEVRRRHKDVLALSIGAFDPVVDPSTAFLAHKLRKNEELVLLDVASGKGIWSWFAQRLKWKFKKTSFPSNPLGSGYSSARYLKILGGLKSKGLRLEGSHHGVAADFLTDPLRESSVNFLLSHATSQFVNRSPFSIPAFVFSAVRVLKPRGKAVLMISNRLRTSAFHRQTVLHNLGLLEKEGIVDFTEHPIADEYEFNGKHEMLEEFSRFARVGAPVKSSAKRLVTRASNYSCNTAIVVTKKRDFDLDAFIEGVKKKHSKIPFPFFNLEKR